MGLPMGPPDCRVWDSGTPIGIFSLKRSRGEAREGCVERKPGTGTSGSLSYSSLDVRVRCEKKRSSPSERGGRPRKMGSQARRV